jgi:hypothetical protein
MPDGPLVDKIEEFIAKYDQSTDSRASKEFLDGLPPITHAVTKRAQRSFHTEGKQSPEKPQPSVA